MATNPTDPFGTEHDDRDYAGKNLVKLGLSAPLVKPPPGHTYLFRTPSLEKEWQDSFARTANPASPATASGPDAPPEPSGFSRPPDALAAPRSTPAFPAESAAFSGNPVPDAGKDAASFRTGQPENIRPTDTSEAIPEPPETSGASARRIAGSPDGLPPAASGAPSGNRAAGAALPVQPIGTGQTAAPTETGGNLRFPGTADER